jgi:hypothetical protein
LNVASCWTRQLEPAIKIRSVVSERSRHHLAGLDNQLLGRPLSPTILREWSNARSLLPSVGALDIVGMSSREAWPRRAVDRGGRESALSRA